MEATDDLGFFNRGEEEARVVVDDFRCKSDVCHYVILRLRNQNNVFSELIHFVERRIELLQWNPDGYEVAKFT